MDAPILEVGAHPILGLPDRVHMRLGSSFELGLATHRNLGADGVLHIGVETPAL